MTKVISDSFSYILLPSLVGSLWPKGSISPICFDKQQSSGVFSVFISVEECGGHGVMLCEV